MKTMMLILLVLVAQATPCQYVTYNINGRYVTCQVCYYPLNGGWTVVNCN